MLRYKFDDENVTKVENGSEVFEKNFGGEVTDTSESQHACNCLLLKNNMIDVLVYILQPTKQKVTDSEKGINI